MSDAVPATAGKQTDRAGGSDTKRVALGLAVPLLAVVVFSVAAWNWEDFRRAMSRIAPYLPITMYALVVVGVVAIAALRWRATRRDEPAPALPPRWQWWTWPVGLTGAVIAFLVPIVDNWQTSRRSYSAVAGVLPWSDANAYYNGAQQLLFGGDIDVVNSWRPFNTAFLSFRLLVTGLDLRSALVIQAVILGGCCFLAARTVARDLGFVAGLALFAGIYGFASFGVETTLTEGLGVAFGALALTILWIAIRDSRPGLAVVGVFVVVLALDVRAGTLLIAVALPLWLAFHFRGSARLNLRVLGAAAAAVVVGFGLNALIVVMLGGSTSNLNGNAYLVLYGLAKGDKGYSQVYVDYPKLAQRPYDEQIPFVRDKVFDLLKSDPGEFAVGVARSGRDYARYSKSQIVEPFAGTSALRYLFYGGLVVLAALVLVRRWRSTSWQEALTDLTLFGGVLIAPPVLFATWAADGSHFPTWLPFVVVVAGFVAFIVIGTGRLRTTLWSLAAVTVVGVAISLPFVPIIDAGPRVYAATVPFFALAFAGTAALLAHAVGIAAEARTRPPAVYDRPVWALAPAAAIVVAIFVVTPIVHWTGSLPTADARRCPNGKRALAFTGGTAVHITKTGEQHDLDELEVSRFYGSAIEASASVEDVRPGDTLLVAESTPPRDARIVLAVIHGRVDAPKRGVLSICGRARPDPNSGHYVFVGKPLRSS